VSGVVFLLLAVIISALGSLFVWFRHARPRSLENSVDSFSREMQALAPRETPTTEARRFRERQK